jgi:serine/threonine protein kinase
MRPSPAIEDVDPERTRVDEGAPAMASLAGRWGRGSILAGKYRLEMLLGEGGMACVWSAYHLELELPVAIKLLRAGPKDAKLAQRLRLEARAAARLVHPSIVRVFDVSVADSGDPFIVMELLSGESLAQLLARERLSSVRAVQLLLPIAEALAVAHANGIVHRDLKPGNVFLSNETRELRPKLLDFGIAKMAHASLVKLTDKGTVLGSPNYMSPEQVRGDDVDYRSDIWSFSVVLYKALTGVLPFKASNAHAIMHEILQSDPAPLGGLVDEELERLVLSGLSKDPAERPRSMREMGRKLTQWLLNQGAAQATPSAPPAPRPRPRRRHGLLLTAAICSLAIGTLAWADSAPDSKPPSTSVAPATFHGATSTSPLLLVAAESPSPAQAEASRPLLPATVSVSPEPIAPPKAKSAPRVRKARAPQLPF